MGEDKMTKYNFAVANDNGNSEHKIMINDELLHQPNVYSVIYSNLGESDDSLETVVSNLYKNIDVRIESKSISGGANRYLIGHSALSSVGGTEIYNMNVQNARKHKENLPVINTLGIIATAAVKKRFHEAKTLENGETIKVETTMTTALPASIHDSKTEGEFQKRFTDNLHEVKVYVKNLTINVQISFNHVKVMKEGVPALFNIIEDGNENYRNDDIFDGFKQEYNYQELDGSHFLEKRLLHLDIGDGTTELVFTEGYTADPKKSVGVKYGLGQAIEKAAVNMSDELDIDISRQLISTYLKDSKHRFRKLAVQHLTQPKKEVAEKLFADTESRLKTLNYEVDVVVAYGGASILLEDVLHEKLKEYCKKYGIEVLWIPAKFAVDMNVKGMGIFNSIKKEELVSEPMGQ